MLGYTTGQGSTTLQPPQFPIIMFMLALTKDFFLDFIVFFATILLLPIGWLLGILISIFVGGILWVWLFFKTGFKRKARGKAIFRLLISTAVGFVPVLRLLIPEYTWVVWKTYRDERKEYRKKLKSV